MQTKAKKRVASPQVLRVTHILRVIPLERQTNVLHRPANIQLT